MNRSVPYSLFAIVLLGGGFGTQAGIGPAEPMRQFYYVNDPAALQSLEQNYARIQIVSPVWFAVNRAGKLESSLDVRLLDWAATRKIDIVPVLVNKNFDAEAAHTVLATPRSRDELAVTLVKIAVLRRLRGLQLDFENIPAGDRDTYTQFAQSLGRGLHNFGMQFSIAVMSPLGGERGPKNGEWQPSQNQQAFDYFQLGAAADFISLMAYDQHTAPDQPGPIAGLPWVDACVRKLLEWVPARKLALGLPLYYRKWSGGKVTEGPFPEAQAEALQWDAKIQIDPEQVECTFDRQDPAGRRTVWLYDARTLRKRLEIVNKYHLRGYSAWRLGQEDPAAWESAF